MIAMHQLNGFKLEISCAHLFIAKIDWHVWTEKLTCNPTATLRSEILLTPACKWISPVKVNFLYCSVPKAEPAVENEWNVSDYQTLLAVIFLGILVFSLPVLIPDRCPLMNTCNAWPSEFTFKVRWPPRWRKDSEGLISTLKHPLIFFY